MARAFHAVDFVIAAGDAFTEANDHGYRPNALGYATNARITVHVDGTRVAGMEP